MSSQMSQLSQLSSDVVFCNDLLFCVAEYLSDKDACRLFNITKSTHSLVKKLKRYQIKSVVTDKMLMKIPSYFIVVIMFTKSMNNLPSSITHLTICGQHDTTCELPNKLKYLEINGNVNLRTTIIPETVKSMSINGLIGDVDLPRGIENIYINNCTGLNLDKLPSNLKYLRISGSFNRFIDYLPVNLRHLTLSSDFNKTVPFLPVGLKHLKFGDHFNQPVDELPPNLTHLIFGRYFNQSLDKLTTTNITYLTLGDEFDQPLPAFPKLMILYVSRYYSHSLKHLPKSTKIFFV